METMIISPNLIPENTRYGYGYPLPEKSVLFLIIVQLHLCKIINDKKLNAMLKSLKDNSIMRQIGTYHCKINNKWYNKYDYPNTMSDIIVKAYRDTCSNPISYDLEVLLKYVHKFTNANRNYNIDWIYHEIIYPYVRNLDTDESIIAIQLFEIPNVHIITYEEADNRNELGFGYCCDDCDGDFENYKFNRYLYHIRPSSSEIEKPIKKYLLSQKTLDARCGKNPNELMR